MAGSRFRIAAVALLTLAFCAATRAGEPQVAFALKGGWVKFTVTQDDKPVPDAVVRVFNAQGAEFAEGESGPSGRGQFPQPPDGMFRVEIKVQNRTADPIALTPVDGAIVPTNVLLSFGLAPCCRAPSRTALSPDPPPPTVSRDTLPVWMSAGVGVAFTLLGAIILVRSVRKVSP